MMSFTKKTAKFSRNKITATAIALLLMLSMTASLVLLPPANAAVRSHFSYMYVSTGSNVVGVGQQVLLVYWTADIPPDIGEISGAVSGNLNRASWSGCSFNVTTPEGVTTNYPMGQSDPVGGGYMLYTPTTVGTYTVISIFPEQWRNGTTNQDYYTSAVSNPVTFDVQQDQIPSWTESPLPIAYWTRPINNAARLWSALPGNWLGGAWQQPAGQAGGTTSRFVYGVGTETSHILWTRPQYVGGYMDARFNDTGYFTGHYQGLSFSAIIINGHIFTAARADASASQGYNVYDLYTGDLLGFYNETMPSYGQIYNYESPNQHGGYSYLWRSVSGLGSGNGTCLEMIDGYVLPLRHVVTICNCSTSGTQVVGWNGELTYYNIVNKGSSAAPDYYLTVWNNTNVLGETATGPNTGTTYWQWRPAGGGFGGGPSYSVNRFLDGSTGFSTNVSIPTPYGPRNSVSNQTGTIRAVRQGDQAGNGGYVILGTTGQNNDNGVVQGQLWCISLDRITGTQGAQMWTSLFTPPFTALTENDSISMIGVYPEDGIILFHSTKKLTYWGYDMKTGKLLWTSAQEPQLNYYSTQYNYYNGLLLTTGYGGVCIAYNMTTGVQAWNFTALNVGLESPYGNYPINIFAICDGKIYLLAGEHSVTQPLWRGPNIRCINATDGTEIWNLLGMGADNGAHLTGMYMQMGDGKVVGLNYFDNQIYCIGPGPSATTVSAPQVVPSLGSSVMITGTVTDQTPTGRRNGNYQFDFTLKGTPAISDASMGRWMEYMFMQQAMPTNATGVPVSLDTVDPNGNYVHIGDVTSDVTGAYGCKFTPEVPGTYQIIATFAGSRSYTGSFAQTYLAVGEAAATPAPTAAPFDPSGIESAIMLYTVAAAVAIIIAIVIVAILILRKRP
jgi:hypothetical protein